MGIAQSNHEHDETERVLIAARPNYHRCDNTVITAKFTVFTFLPLVSGDGRMICRMATSFLKKYWILWKIHSHCVVFACFIVTK